MKSRRKASARRKVTGLARRKPAVLDEIRRRAWLWLVAVLLAIVFLAGECAYLLPVE